MTQEFHFEADDLDAMADDWEEHQRILRELNAQADDELADEMDEAEREEREFEKMLENMRIELHDEDIDLPDFDEDDGDSWDRDDDEY